MANLPPIELLKATHTFPGSFHFKVIGENENDLLDRVLARVRDQLKFEVSHSTRTTSGERHIAISLDVKVKTAEDVLHIYKKLRELKVGDKSRPKNCSPRLINNKNRDRVGEEGQTQPLKNFCVSFI